MGIYDGEGRCSGVLVKGHVEGGRAYCVAEVSGQGAGEVGVKYPRCLDGERACPPEDCGGAWGYEELLEVLNDPDHEDYEHYRGWAGEDFDPERFDLEKVNRTLGRV